MEILMSKGGVAYQKVGSGVPVVLVHGVGLCADSWRWQVQHLQRHFTVYALDLPGHGNSRAWNADIGNSTDSTQPITLQSFKQTLIDFISQEVRAPAFLIGHSLGALLVLHIATSVPCLGVVALNAIAYRDATAQQAIDKRLKAVENKQHSIDATLNRWFVGEFPAIRAQCFSWLSSITQNNPTDYAAAYRVFARHNAPDKLSLSALRIPALMITGDKDVNSTPAMSVQLSASIKRGESHVIAGAGHIMQLTHPDIVNRVIQHFLHRTVE